MLVHLWTGSCSVTHLVHPVAKRALWLGGCLILKGVRTWIRPIARRRAVSRRMSHYFCVYSIYMYHVYSGKQTYYILVSWKMGLLKVYFPWSLLCLPEGSPCYLVALNFATFTASFLFGLREIVACTGLALWGQDCTGRIFHDLGWMRFPNIMWGIASNAEVFLQSLVAINWRSRHGAPIWVWPPHYHLFARGGAEFCIDSWSLWNWWAEDVSLLQMRIHFANLIGWRWEIGWEVTWSDCWIGPPAPSRVCVSSSDWPTWIIILSYFVNLLTQNPWHFCHSIKWRECCLWVSRHHRFQAVKKNQNMTSVSLRGDDSVLPLDAWVDWQGHL